VGVLLAVALLVGSQVGLPPPVLLRVPAASLRAPALTGALSSLGVLALACTAALCAGAAFLVGGRRGGETGRFLTVSAAVTTLLCIDDAFMLHESLLPHFGIPEPLVFAGYAIAGAAYLIRWRQHLLHRTEVSVLGVAAILLGTSVVADAFAAGDVTAASTIAEDVPKLLGIAVWSTYFVRCAADAVAPLLHPERSRSEMGAALPTPPTGPARAGAEPRRALPRAE